MKAVFYKVVVFDAHDTEKYEVYESGRNFWAAVELSLKMTKQTGRCFGFIRED